jgi:hypothetical protein
MSTKVTIPATLKEAERVLGSIEGLVTAREWERAAIVWAFTEEGKGGPRTGRELAQLSIRAFAERGIHGLRSKDSVRRYRYAWDWAMEYAEAKDVHPGDRVTLPDAAWEEVEFPIRDGSQERYVGKDPDKVARAIGRGDIDAGELAAALAVEVAPADRAKAAKELLTDPSVRRMVVRDTGARADWSRTEQEEDARNTARHHRHLREAAPGFMEWSEFVEVLSRLSHANQDLKKALELLRGLPPLSAEARAELKQDIDWLATKVDWLGEFTKARRAASLGDEIEAYLADQTEGR